MPKPVETTEVKKEDEFSSTTPSDIWRDIRENK